MYKSMQKFFLAFLIPIITLFIGMAYADTSCVGATYYNASNNTCIACPAGYTDNTTAGKTAANQCQKSCDAGTFIATPATVGGSTDYTRLEYIENPNGKYIDTGFKHSSTATTIRGVLRVGVSTNLPNSKNVNFIGNQVSGGGYSLGWNAYFKLWTESSKSRLNGPAYAMTAGTVHEVEYELTNSTRALRYDNGDTASDTFSGGKILSNNNIHIYDGGNHQNDRQFTGRIYDLKVYEDDVLVHNFVAARRNSDSVVGMYDIVTDTFLTGTGTFTAGPDAGGCSDVGIGYYSNASLTNYGSVGTRLGCTNGPAHAHYTASATSNSCPYACDDNYVLQNGVCEFQDKFAITTTSDATELLFDISAIGTFYVDCGPGGTLTQTEYDSGNNAAGTVITRTTTTKRTYSCAWPAAGVHTVQFAGVATSYNTNATTPAITFYSTNATTSSKIASMSGSLSAIFPQKGASNGQIPRFYQSFFGATNLTSISAGLFAGLVGGTNATNMFRETFKGCTSLTTIPDDLFSDITSAASGLFQATFKGSTNLTGSIPPTTFEGLIANNSPTTTNMWTETFNGTNVATTCSVGETQYITNYESEWDGRVSCVCAGNHPANSSWANINGECVWLCDAGYYTTDNTSCTDVGVGFYSAAGDNTRTACPAGLSTQGYGHGADEAADCGHVLHFGNYFIYSKTTKDTTPAVNIQIQSNEEYYIGLSPTNHSLSKLHFMYGGQKYTAYDDGLIYGERDPLTGNKIEQ